MFEQVTLIGNLGGDPELKEFDNGNAVTNFSFATNRKWKDSNGQQQTQTTWWRIAVWGAQAKPCTQYLSKGSSAMIIGTMNSDPETGSPRQWTDGDGNVRSGYELNSSKVQFLNTRSEGAEYQGTPVQEEDDIPF